MKKLLHIVGTRPQYIKLFPLHREFAADSKIAQSIYDTGQHYDDKMSGEILAEFGLEVEAGNVKGLAPEQQIPLMIGNIWTKLNELAPDYVFIYGDTNTTLAAAIVCAKLQIPYGHVEAGGRTLPHVGIQEAINRKIADHLATHLFCSNHYDESNLLNEGIDPSKILLCGDVMFDSFKLIEQQLEPNIIEKTSDRPELLVTVHRAENVDDTVILNNIIDAVVKLSHDYNIRWPVHPRLNARLSNEQRNKLSKDNITLLPPLTYGEVVAGLKHATGLITDSGGMSKDAACAGIVSIVLRDDPIWKDLEKLGYIKTVGNMSQMTAAKIENKIRDSLANTELKTYEPPKTAPKIHQFVTAFLEKNTQ